MPFSLSNRAVAVNYVNISDKELFFEYNKVIKYVGRAQIYHKFLRSFLDLITL